MTTNSIYNIAVFGFTNIERTLMNSICKLSQARIQRAASIGQAGYQIVQPASSIDILLVDADDPSTLQQGIDARTQNPQAPLMLVSKVPQAESDAGVFTLERHRLGGLLLKSLDEIVEQWIKHNTSAAMQTVNDQQAKTCLVVDDSQLVRTQMELILGDHPLNITFAEDAENALQRVKKQPFDIIFLDVMLPEMNGYKACKLIKTDPSTSATPVVMLTSKKSPFNKMHGALVGCDKYLTKPVDANKVQQVLKQYELI